MWSSANQSSRPVLAARAERETKPRHPNGHAHTLASSRSETVSSAGLKQPSLLNQHHQQQQQARGRQPCDPRSHGAADCSSSGPVDPGLARQLSDTGAQNHSLTEHRSTTSSSSGPVDLGLACQLSDTDAQRTPYQRSFGSADLVHCFIVISQPQVAPILFKFQQRLRFEVDFENNLA